MDATAVAAARGVAGISRRDAWVLAGLFGAFQGGMAALGWAGGAVALRWIAAWDHWVAFGLLAALGVRMIVEALRAGPEDPDRVLSLRLMLVLAVATSIDALAAGVTLPMLAVREEVTVALIGGFAAVLSLLGVQLGRRLGARLGSRLELVGGLALVAIGVKILVEHLR
jgi:manganese efflux pump family protein